MRVDENSSSGGKLVDRMAPDDWTPPFKSHLVLTEHTWDPGIRAYYIGFDDGKFRLEPVARVIIDVLPEFALGYYQGTTVDLRDIVPRLRDAALRIYSSEKYQRRGEFGELILHLLLRDFCRSVPLISKIHFKDSVNSTVHGFDGVHVVVTTSVKQLWVGESKLYEDGPDGIRELVNDLKKHIAADYLRQEFMLISPKLPENFPDIEYWRTLLHQNQRLDVILSSLCIAMVCTYTSRVYQDHCDNTRECLEEFLNECKQLQAVFEEAARDGKTKVTVILFLVPVASKAALVDELHRRLKAMQAI
jgi:hypothetical protein